MEDEKKNPSFPSNYVTLVQLQERWLKEKERKQREEEEEQLRKLQQEREQKRKEEEDRKASDRTIEADSKPSNRNGRMQNRRYRRDAPVKEVEVDGGERADQERKSEGKKKKKKKNKGKKPNVAVEEEVTGKEGVASEPPADIVKEDAPARRNGESRRHVVEFRAKMKNLPETAEIEAKLENLSVKNGTEKVNDGLRKTKTQNHRGRGEIGGNRSRGLNLGDGWKRKDANWVWVKKGEAIDGNVTG
ncbi:hypothetical protein UlMin_035397 [Ulmus minor]